MSRNRRQRNRNNKAENRGEGRGNNRGHNRNKRKKRFTNKISDHFSKKDFVCQCGNCKQSIKISLGLIGGLELLRSTAGKRINILKGYQCQESAEAEGSFKRNFYTTGVAAKITIDDTDPKDAFLLAESVPEFMGIGLNLDDNTLIVDTRKADERVLWVVEKGSQIDITDDTRSKYFKEVKGEDVNADENQPSDATSEAAANEAAAVSNDHSA